MNDKDITRRDFIQRLSLFGAIGVGASSVLAACGGEQQAVETPEAPEVPAEEPDMADADFSCDDVSGLTEQEIAARQSLNYVDESPMEGKYCDNCALYVAAEPGEQCGGCQTIKGPIHPKGYCDIWTAQAG